MNLLLGAIGGDIIGSVYEFNNIRTKRFPLFIAGESTYTDDTIMTIATADAILTGASYESKYVEWGRKYPNPCGGYGAMFGRWLNAEKQEPYNSFGNGSAMRVSPVGLACNDYDQVFREAWDSARCTHDHPDGIRGAQAVAVAVNMAKCGCTRQRMMHEMRDFGYDVTVPLNEIRNFHQFSETCEDAVPIAFRAFYESESYEDAIRNAVSMGGDSDTIAAITGGIALAYYKKMRPETEAAIIKRLPADMLAVIEQWEQEYGK